VEEKPVPPVLLEKEKTNRTPKVESEGRRRCTRRRRGKCR